MPYVVLTIRQVEKYGEETLGNEEAPREACIEAALNKFESNEGLTLLHIVGPYDRPYRPDGQHSPLFIFRKPAAEAEPPEVEVADNPFYQR